MMPTSHEKMIKDLQSLVARKALGHAYIFFGPARIGKAAAAQALAAFIETGVWPAEMMLAAAGPEAMPTRPLTDMQVFSPDDKGTLGIDAARAVTAFLGQKPFVSARRVAIIERAELLTPQAQNALLKTAEEPPESALLILVVTDPELLWPALQSRFQKIYFPPPPQAEMRARLKAVEDPLAAKFFGVAPAARKDFVKELTEPEDFNFAAFLDSLIAYMATGGSAIKNGKLWHAVLELRRMQDATNLSPRIQLMNLWTLI